MSENQGNNDKNTNTTMENIAQVTENVTNATISAGQQVVTAIVGKPEPEPEPTTTDKLKSSVDSVADKAKEAIDGVASTVDKVMENLQGDNKKQGDKEEGK